MDKTRDVRRVGASRFSPAKRQFIKQSGLDRGGRGVLVSEKSKKEKLRRLSVVGRVSSSNEDSEMGCVGSDEEDEVRPTASISKRIKFPNKFFDEYNSVDHASVPRKLRSAMKKRSRESISPPLPDLKKLKHTLNGVELLSKDNIKKSKLNMQQADSEEYPRQAIVGPITKDEEEVVETLYALARMFPDTDKTDKIKLDGELSEVNSSAFPETEGSVPTFEVPKEDNNLKTSCSRAIAEAANRMNELEGSTVETTEASQPDLPNRKQLPVGLESLVNLPMISLSYSKTESTIERPSCNSSLPSELSTGTGSKAANHEGAQANGRKLETSLGPVAAVGSQHELQHAITESKNNGSALGPGISLTGSLAETQGPSLQSSTAKLPSWLSSATCASRPCSSENVVITEKDCRVPVDRKRLWKRCSAHVYISRLIKVLQIRESKDTLPVQPTQLTPEEGSKHGAPLAANNLNRGRDGMNGVISINSKDCSAAGRNPNEVRNAILLHKRLLQDQQQASTTSGLYTLQKQSFDFLALSAGACGIEAKNGINRAGNALEPLTQFQVPYLQSLAQNHTIMPFSVAQNYYSSAPFPSHLSAAAAHQVQIQLPPYLGSTFCGPPHLGTTASPKQPHQQQNWSAQLAAQYKPIGVASPHIPNWQNGRRDSPSLVQYAQAILPPSCSPVSPLEVLGPRYAPISPQQQQLVSITPSFPPSVVKRQHQHLPSGYKGNGGFHPDSAPSLQLLCNEHL